MKPRIIGIVGGMGPEAGIALHKSILFHTNAQSDQEHLPVITMSFPGLISDRTAFLEGNTYINPGYEIVKIVDRLSMAGAEVIGIACNTSHVPRIFDVIQDEVNKMSKAVRVLSMPYEVGRCLKRNISAGNRVGILMTNGTYKSRLYENIVQEAGCTAVVADVNFQNNVIHKMIYDPIIGIKANCGNIRPEAQRLFKKAMDFFISRDCTTMILGCTELSLTSDLQREYNVEFIDSTQCLANALVIASTIKLDETQVDAQIGNVLK